MRRAPAAAQALAIAQAMLRLFATPNTTPTLPSNSCVITTATIAGTVAAVYSSRPGPAEADDRRLNYCDDDQISPNKASSSRLPDNASPAMIPSSFV